MDVGGKMGKKRKRKRNEEGGLIRKEHTNLLDE